MSDIQLFNNNLAYNADQEDLEPITPDRSVQIYEKSSNIN